MFRTVLYLVQFWIYQFIAIPGLIVLWWLNRRGQTEKALRLAQKWSTPWAAWNLRKAGVSLQVEGLENVPDGPVVIASNHQGVFDIPILMVALDRPVAFIAKQELLKIPLVGRWMRAIGCIAIDRSSARGAIETFKRASTALKAGQTLVIFPEGTRSNSATMIPFKQGSLRVVHQAGVPLLPVTLNHSYKIKQEGSMAFHPTDVIVRVHPPVDVSGLDKAARKELPARTQETVASGLV